jgi:hypothetical protein
MATQYDIPGRNSTGDLSQTRVKAGELTEARVEAGIS